LRRFVSAILALADPAACTRRFARIDDERPSGGLFAGDKRRRDDL